MVKAVAERTGWEHSRHHHLYQGIDRVAAETGDDQLRDLFLEAGAASYYFYEDWLPSDMEVRRGERVKALLARLERALQVGD